MATAQKKSCSSSLMLINTLLIAVFVVFYVAMQVTAGVSRSTEGHQAVFLSNGQVYFAEVTSDKGDFINLEDVYYLRVQRDLQPAPEGQQTQAGVQLVRLGNELHGPENFMAVNKDHVLFTEPLKEDSAVVQAIAQETENRENGTATETPTEQPTPTPEQPTTEETPTEPTPEPAAEEPAPVEPAPEEPVPAEPTPEPEA